MNKQKGFTLIELLVVVAIIGLLASIAIPQFAEYKKRAFDSRAESDLQSGLRAEEAYYVDNEAYIDCWTPTECETLLPGFVASDGVDIEYPAQISDSEFSGSSCHPKGTKTYYWRSSGSNASIARGYDNSGSCDASPPTIS